MIGIFISLWNRLFGGGISYVLDEYSGAAAAYSLRKLSSTYGGSAVRVRRASDNSEQDIGFVGQDLDETALMNFVGYQNLYLQSQTFNTVSWTKGSSTVTANAGTDPFGGNAATRWLSDVGSTTHYLAQAQSLTVGQSYTVSFWIKSNTVSNQSFRLYGSNGITSSDLTATTDWQRFSFSFVATSSTDHGIARPSTNAAVDLLIYGAQLNAGTTAQPYQVTTSAARSGDGFVTKWYTQDSNWENLLLQSQTFETANWNKFNSSIVADNTTAPDGTLTADKLNETAVTGQHGCVQVYTIPSANIYTFSIYVKAAERSTVNIVVYFNGGATDNFSARFNLSTGVVTFTSTGGAGVLVSSTIQSVGNGWYRCSIIGNTTMSGSHSIQLGLLDAALNTTYLGVAGSGVFIWGAQLSQSNWLQPYQVTTTTAILRRDASQSTAANQPRIVGGGVIERENGKASIRFDGVNDYFVGTDVALPIFSIFAAAVNTIPSASLNTIYNRGTSTANNTRDVLFSLVGGSNNTVSVQRSEGTTYPSSSSYTSVSNYLVASGIYTGSQLTAFADSIAGASITTTVTGSINPLTLIGATSQNIGISFYMGGEIGEVIVYNSDRTSTRADIERNIGAYYQTHWTGASSGLLDQFGGAAAAYSLRNLSSSYRGPLIRVRRSSDNAETDIGGTYNGDLDVASLLSFTGGQNLLLNSDNFTAASWGLGGLTVTSNVTIAPDGTLTADSLNETATNQNHVIFQTASPSVAGPITSSVYLKAKERRYVSLSVATNGPTTFIRYGVIVDLQEGVITRSDILRSASGVYYSVSSAGNGWWRVSVSINATTVGVNSNFIVIALSNSPNPVFASDTLEPTYLGVAGSGVYIWGAQLNTGILQPYIPTTTTAVNGENAFVTKWYTQDNNYQNLLLYSEQFENAYWIKNLCTITPNAIVAPNGSNTGELFTKTSGVNTLSRFSTTPYLTTGIHTYSIYVKQNVGDSLQLRMDVGGNTINSTWTFSTKSFSNTAAVISASYQELPNGWFRLSVVGNVTSTGWSLDLVAFTNPINDSFYVWGAQLNEGNVAQPYTATTNTISQRRDAIQATAASQPRIVNAGGVESEGNRPALFFDGVDDAINFDTVAPLFAGEDIPLSAFSTVRSSASGWFFALGDSVAPNPIHGYSTVVGSGIDNFRRSSSSTQVVVANTDPSNIYKLNSHMFAGTTLSVSNNAVDNIVNAPQNVPSLDSLNRATIGALRYQASPNGSVFFGGDVGEFILYRANQFSLRQPIQSNINSYYRIYWQGNGTALLDNFSGASAAYSLRNLSSAYTGPLIRVRRSSDNVERDIYGTFGGDLDIASLVAFVGANSGFVTTWYDQSGNARNATQGTAANQPRIVNAGVVDTLNGKPSVLFNGTSQQLTTPTVASWMSNTAYSIYMAERMNSVLSNHYFAGIAGPPASSRALILGYRNLTQLTIAHYQDDANFTFDQTQVQRLHSLYFKNPTSEYFVNNISLGTQTNPVNPLDITSGGLQIGGALGSTFYYNGYIQEFCVYTSNKISSGGGIASNINNYYKIY